MKRTRCPVNGKQQHTSKTSALMSALRQIRYDAPTLSTYRCPHCRHWHLTKKPQNPA